MKSITDISAWYATLKLWAAPYSVNVDWIYEWMATFSTFDRMVNWLNILDVSVLKGHDNDNYELQCWDDPMLFFMLFFPYSIKVFYCTNYKLKTPSLQSLKIWACRWKHNFFAWPSAILHDKGIVWKHSFKTFLLALCQSCELIFKCGRPALLTR